MKSIKDWISCHSKPLLSARPLSGFFDEEPSNESFNDPGSTALPGSLAPVSADPPTHSSIDNQVNEFPSSSQPVVGDHHFSCDTDCRKGDPLAKLKALQIRFLRLVHRLGQSMSDPVVAQALYRLQLAVLIQAGQSDVKENGLKISTAKQIAIEQEAAGEADLDFSFKILVLGKTGVGKSATINSIFNQAKVVTDAFRPATNKIQEIVGTVSGIEIRIIDTPGLLPSCCNPRQNRKILLSVKRFIRKSRPDIVLYFDRLDLINMDYSDFPLFKLITDVFGSAIWFNTIFVMTHSSDLLEGPDGYAVNFEAFVDHRTNLLQDYIHRAVSDTRLENPVLLVENHPLCETNLEGQKVLPNGQAWISRFLLLCISSKVLGEANALFKFRDAIQERQISTKLPSLPHLLSSLLQPRSLPSMSGFYDKGGEKFAEMDDDDEYDKLPPIRILTKTQFNKLTKSQKKDYLDELDYRETLYLKKQWKEQLRRHGDRSVSEDEEISPNDNDYENAASPELVPLPDMAIPLSFDSDSPVYRYRCLISGREQWLVRPVLDSQGWDHDVGFEGINLETSLAIKRDVHASFVGQMNMDKQDFNFQSESAVAHVGENGSSYGGIDIQNASNGLVCTIRGDSKIQNMKINKTGIGFSITSLGNKYFFGTKLEDSILISNRLKMVLNAGSLRGQGQTAYGGSLEASLIGRDYPVRNDKTSLALSVLSLDGEAVLGGSLQSEFRVGHGNQISLSGNLNSRRMGQVCIKASSSEQLEMALLLFAFPVIRSLFRRTREDSRVT